MSNRSPTFFGFLLFLLLICVLTACGMYPGTSRGPFPSPLPTPTITPTPFGYVEPTRTPTPTWDVNYDPSNVTPEPPTATPVTVNMADGWPKIFTYSFTIKRANGQYEIYTVPVGNVPMVHTDSDRKIYEQYIQSVAHLGPGDTIVYGCAASAYIIFVPQDMICIPPMQAPHGLP